MKNANDCITNAQQIIAEFADKLTDEGRADLAVVVALGKFQKSQSVMLSCYRTGRRPSERLLDEHREAADAVDAALAAAGVEVKREG